MRSHAHCPHCPWDRVGMVNFIPTKTASAMEEGCRRTGVGVSCGRDDCVTHPAHAHPRDLDSLDRGQAVPIRSDLGTHDYFPDNLDRLARACASLEVPTDQTIGYSLQHADTHCSCRRSSTLGILRVGPCRYSSDRNVTPVNTTLAFR